MHYFNKNILFTLVLAIFSNSSTILAKDNCEKRDPIIGTHTAIDVGVPQEFIGYYNVLINEDGTVITFSTNNIQALPAGNSRGTAFTGCWKKTGKCTYKFVLTNVVANVDCEGALCNSVTAAFRQKIEMDLTFNKETGRSEATGAARAYHLTDLNLANPFNPQPFVFAL